MSGIEVGAAVFSLITGTIEIIHQAAEIYGAVHDKSGIPRALKKVSEKLPLVEEILRSAEAQYDAGKLNQIDEQTWVDVKQEVEQCKNACQQLHDLLLSAYPKADSGKSERLWKGAKTVLSGKGRSAEMLFKEISEYLGLLAERQIIENTVLLREIKTIVEELCPPNTSTRMHNTHGDNVGILNGDKVSGNKNVNSGSGNQFIGAGGVYHIGGARSEEIQCALLSSRHRDHRPFSEENCRILRKWLSRSHGKLLGLTVTDSDRIRFERVYRRISDDDPISTYKRLSARKAANTTGWLVNHEDFKSWVSGELPSKRRLWLSGKVGSGKSTLVTTVIDQCHARRGSHGSSTVLMFFFQSRKDTVLSCFESLTKQLIAALVCVDIPCLARVLSALEEAYGNDISRPDIAQVFTELVLPLCRHLKRITLVIDGIDECEAAETTLLWRWLNELLDNIEVKILITSEDQANVPLYLKGFSRLRIDQQHNKVDIDAYIEEQISRKSAPGQIFCDKSLREKVKKVLQQKADGMFLWIYLVLRIILEYCETPAEVKSAVDAIPPDLQAVYALCLETRRNASRAINVRLYVWICAAPNSLSVDALRELLAMDLETGQVNTDEMLSIEGLLRSGAGLITIDANTRPGADFDERLIVPIHSTVRDFVFSERFRSLLSNGQDSWPQCAEAGDWSERTFRSALGSLSIAYINKRTSRELRTSSKPTRVPVYPPKIPWFIPKILLGGRYGQTEMTVDFSRIALSMAKVPVAKFLRYAIENWLTCNKELSPSTAKLPWITIEGKKSGTKDTAGLFEAVAMERNDSFGVHPWYSISGSLTSHLSHMFAYAVASNHIPLLQVVKRHRRSLPQGVFDRPLAQHDRMLAIHVAAKKGFSLIIEELADICDMHAICPSTGKHVLHFIASAGHRACLQPLLPMALDWNARDREGHTPLFAALKAGHHSIVRALLKTKKVGRVNIDIESSGILRPRLQQKAISDKVAYFLLKEDNSETDTENINSSALLQLVEYYGYDNLLQMLLDMGKVNINARDENGETLLLWAASRGYPEIVQLLIETGNAEVNAMDNAGGHPLLSAASGGHDKVVKLLLDTGKVAINALDRDGRTSLAIAAHYGHHNIVQLLLERAKATINAMDRLSLTPLSWAAIGGHNEVVQLLLKTGKVEINAPDFRGRTPLLQAAYHGHSGVVKLFLETGKAGIDIADEHGRTPLWWAAS